MSVTEIIAKEIHLVCVLSFSYCRTVKSIIVRAIIDLALIPKSSGSYRSKRLRLTALSVLVAEMKRSPLRQNTVACITVPMHHESLKWPSKACRIRYLVTDTTTALIH